VTGHLSLLDISPVFLYLLVLKRVQANIEGFHETYLEDKSMIDRQRYADILLFNGRILTVDQDFSIHQAVATHGSRILAVGRNEALRSLIGSHTRTIDLQGQTVIPGIIDTHAHMDREGLKKIMPSLEGCRSISDILSVIKREARSKKPGEWVVTMPIGDPPNFEYLPSTLAEGRCPTRRELDSVAPNNPVYIRGIWSPWNAPPSISIANSYALKLAGIDRNTSAPHRSVIIERDSRGEPTGVIVDDNMFPVTEFSIMRVVPRFSKDERVEALKNSMYLYNSVGITSIYEGHGVAPEVLEAYKKIWYEDGMTVRSHLVISPTWNSMREAERDMSRWGWCPSRYGFGDDMLRVCGFFIQLRGQRHVAKLRSAELPYTGWAGFAISYNSYPRFLALLRMAAQHRLRVHTIASTEEMVEEVLRALEMVQKEFTVIGRRWVIEHVRDVTPTQLKRMKRLGVVCETIPLTHIWLRGAGYLGDPRRADRAVPHHSFLQYSIPFSMGTDNKPYNPFHTLWAAVSRIERSSGQVIGPKQCLSRAQALRAFTMGGAYLCGQEESRGSLETGKLADLAVLSQDPLKVPENLLPETHSLLTIVGGRVVYSNNELDEKGDSIIKNRTKD